MLSTHVHAKKRSAKEWNSLGKDQWRSMTESIGEEYEDGEDDPPEEEDTNDPTNPNFYKDAAKKAKFALVFVTLKGKGLVKAESEALAQRWKGELKHIGIKVDPHV